MKEELEKHILDQKIIKVPVEVYSRVVGYFRPVSQWNMGKKEEFRERKEYILRNISYTNH